MSFTMGGLNYVTTILKLRAKGMSLMRMPLTVWTMFVAAALELLTFPPLTAAAVMLLFDRHLGTSFFAPGGLVISGQPVLHEGGTPLLWQHLFWFLGHPEVYVLVLPALGVIVVVLAPFTRRPRGDGAGENVGHSGKRQRANFAGAAGQHAQLALWWFMATVTMLFAAFASAYLVRRTGTD